LRARVNLTSAANPNIAIWCQAPARADTVAVPVAIPEATSASTDKTASAAAHVDRTAATAATHVHRTAPTAATHTSAADMHPAAADAGMHPTAVTTTTAAPVGSVTTMAQREINSRLIGGSTPEISHSRNCKPPTIGEINFTGNQASDAAG
jgi:hypothetical protein